MLNLTKNQLFVIFTAISIISILLYVNGPYYYQSYGRKWSICVLPTPLYAREKIVIKNESTSPKYLTKDASLIHFLSNKNVKLSQKLLSKFQQNYEGTSARYTTIKVVNAPEKRQKFLAIITARNTKKVSKDFGGDVFRVVLYRGEGFINGIVCDVKDLNNGIYMVSAPAMFNGNLTVLAQLIHSKESLDILEIKTSEFGQPYTNIKTTFKNSKNITEKSVCNMGFSEPLYKSPKLCDYSGTTPDQSWFCLQPKSGECNPMLDLGGSVRDTKAKPFMYPYQSYFQRDVTFFANIEGNGQTIKSIADPDLNQSLQLHSCYQSKDSFFQQSLDNKQSGYFHNGEWVSLLCKNTYLYIRDHTRFAKCMENKNIYLFGDSTSRQWFSYYEEKKVIKANSKDPKASLPPRTGIFINGNGKIHLYAHGYPIQAKGGAHYIQYATDNIKDIPSNTSGVIIVLSMGLHFSMYNPEIFRLRIQEIKKAIISLIQRIPTAQIYIKDISMHIATGPAPSPWLGARQNDIIRHEFSDVNNTRHLNVHDMTAVQITKDVHPYNAMLEHQLAFFQSFICNN